MRAWRTLEPSEDAIQCSLIELLRLMPDERRHAFHIPNEAKRSVVGHAQQKRMGRTKGASDVMIPMARAGWNGMFLELKAKDKKPTDEQQQFLADMTACGYYATWADNLDDALTRTHLYAMGQIIRPNWVHYAATAINP